MPKRLSSRQKRKRKRNRNRWGLIPVFERGAPRSRGRRGKAHDRTVTRGRLGAHIFHIPRFRFDRCDYAGAAACAYLEGVPEPGQVGGHVVIERPFAVRTFRCRRARGWVDSNRVARLACRADRAGRRRDPFLDGSGRLSAGACQPSANRRSGFAGQSSAHADGWRSGYDCKPLLACLVAHRRTRSVVIRV